MSYPHLTADDQATLTAFFQAVDTDSDGKISVAEIKSACRVDTDGDGSITAAEIDTSALPWLNDFAAQDFDDDAKISLSELLTYNENIKAASQ